VDFLFIILGNLHRHIRQKRRPAPPRTPPPPRTPRSDADRAFLTGSVLGALVLLVIIGLLWTML
jgi:hypothetical protein